MEKQRFVDKIALVTGGANGLGRGLVEQLLEEGARVAIFDLEDDTMEEVFGGDERVYCIKCDVRDQELVQQSVQKVIDRWGRIDVLFNNAGIVRRSSFLECSKEDWCDVIDTNLTGEFYVAQAVARTMVDLGVKGYIVNTSSNTSRKPVTNNLAYPPSKAGVSMLTMVMALELAQYGIHVNAIGPGTTKTRLTRGTTEDPVRSKAFLAKMPFGRYGEISEMVSVSLFLASEDASFIHGETIYEEGGWSLM